MLALGAAQTGLLLALEKPARRLLERGVLWTTTVLINSVIMTVFLWHFTTLILVSALALFTGVGLSFFPGTDAWWLTRPLWIAVLVLALVPFVAAFTRFERNVLPPHRAAPPAWQLLLGCALVSFGLVPLTLHGIPTESWPGFNLLALALPFIGAALVRFGPARTRELENEEVPVAESNGSKGIQLFANRNRKERTRRQQYIRGLGPPRRRGTPAQGANSSPALKGSFASASSSKSKLPRYLGFPSPMFRVSCADAPWSVSSAC